MTPDVSREFSVDPAERGYRRVDCIATSRGEGDELRAAILGIRPRSQVTQLHKVAYEFGHGLLGDASTLREVRQAETVVGDMSHDVVVNSTVILETGCDEALLECVDEVALCHDQKEKEGRVVVGVGHGVKNSQGT